MNFTFFNLGADLNKAIYRSILVQGGYLKAHLIENRI